MTLARSGYVSEPGTMSLRIRARSVSLGLPSRPLRPRTLSPARHPRNPVMGRVTRRPTMPSLIE